MKKDTESRHKAEPIETKYFEPDEELMDFMQKRLELEKQRNEFLRKKNAGKKLPNSFYKAIKSSGSRKTEILNDIIFPSMANLMYFFDQIYHSPQLSELFEKDIIDLLDPTYAQQDMLSLQKRGDTSAYVFRNNNFARLVLTALKIPEQKMNGLGPLTDFRISLLYQLQSIVRELVRDMLKKSYDLSGVITVKAIEDFDNTLRWLTFIGILASDRYPGYPHRDIRIGVMDYPRNND